MTIGNMTGCGSDAEESRGKKSSHDALRRLSDLHEEGRSLLTGFMWEGGWMLCVGCWVVGRWGGEDRRSSANSSRSLGSIGGSKGGTYSEQELIKKGVSSFHRRNF